MLSTKKAMYIMSRDSDSFEVICEGGTYYVRLSGSDFWYEQSGPWRPEEYTSMGWQMSVVKVFKGNK